MKIILEATTLGLGHWQKSARTGVFRVAEEILKGLINTPIIDVGIGASNWLPEVLTYLAEEFPEEYFNYVNLSKEVQRSARENSFLNTFSQKTLPTKVVRAILMKVRRNDYHFDTQKLTHFDIFHSPFHPFSEEVSQIKSLKKVITIHDLIPKLYPQFFGEWNRVIMDKILACIQLDTQVICVSESTKNDLCNAIPISPEQISVIPLAASPEKFYPYHHLDNTSTILEKYKIPLQPYLLSLATLEPRKNIERTIRAFLTMIQQQKITDLNLVLVGSKGWHFDTIFQEIQENPALQSRIIITGYVDDEDLAPLYSQALAFVYPSLYEGFGLPPLEAMQCGVPVISSKNSSIPEVVGEAGILVEPTDETAISDAMLAIYQEENLRQNLSKKSLLQATKFNWEKFHAEHLALYKKIL